METTQTTITPAVRQSIEAAQHSINLAVEILIGQGLVGLAAEIGDARDLLDLLANNTAAEIIE